MLVSRAEIKGGWGEESSEQFCCCCCCRWTEKCQSGPGGGRFSLLLLFSAPSGSKATKQPNGRHFHSANLPSKNPGPRGPHIKKSKICEKIKWEISDLAGNRSFFFFPFGRDEKRSTETMEKRTRFFFLFCFCRHWFFSGCFQSSSFRNNEKEIENEKGEETPLLVRSVSHSPLLPVQPVHPPFPSSPTFVSPYIPQGVISKRKKEKKGACFGLITFETQRTRQGHPKRYEMNEYPLYSYIPSLS